MGGALSQLFNDEPVNLRGKVIGIYALSITANLGAISGQGEEVRKRAPSIRAAGLRSSFLQTAETYDRLAVAEETAGETKEPDVSDKPRS